MKNKPNKLKLLQFPISNSWVLSLPEGEITIRIIDDTKLSLERACFLLNRGAYLLQRDAEKIIE